MTGFKRYPERQPGDYLLAFEARGGNKIERTFVRFTVDGVVTKPPARKLKAEEWRHIGSLEPVASGFLPDVVSRGPRG